MFKVAAWVGSVGQGIACSAVYPLLFALSAGHGIRFREKQVSNMMMAPMLSQMCLAGSTGMVTHRNINLLF